MKPAITKTKKFLAVLMCIFMLSSFAVPFAGAEDVAANNLEWLVEDEQKTVKVPSTDTPNTLTLPEARLQGEGEITYSLCSDADGEIPFAAEGIAIKEASKPIITIENSAKNYMNAINKTSFTLYVKATAKLSADSFVSTVIEITVENFKVHVTFVADDGKTVLDEGDVYYGTSAETIGKKLEEKIKAEIAAEKPHELYHNFFGDWIVIKAEDSSSTYADVKCDTTFKVFIDQALHSIDAGEVTKKATCTEDGEKLFKCTGCSYSYTETIPKGHKIDAEGTGYEKIDPTCTTDGYEKGVCSVCGASVTIELPAHGHKYKITQKAVLPTCQNDGWTEGKECIYGDDTVAATKLDKLPHTEETIAEAQEPTCTTDGHTEKVVCKVCGEIIKNPEILPATGHKDMDEITPAAPSTCTKKGHTAGHICSVCGFTEDATVFPALGHSMVTDVEAKEATCTEKGCTKGEHCTRCDLKEVSKELPALGHDIEIDQASPATCTEPAKSEGSHCKRCNAVLKAQETTGEALGHDIIVYEAAKPATCKNHGMTAGKKCTRCDYKEEPTETALIDHEYAIVPGEEDIDPTCTEKGYRAARVCVVCGNELPGEEIPALGHVDDNDDNKCDVCGEEITHIDPSEGCPHFCHSTNIFKKILWKIVRSLYKLLGIQKFCDCGVAHYN